MELFLNWSFRCRLVAAVKCKNILENVQCKILDCRTFYYFDHSEEDEEDEEGEESEEGDEIQCS